MANPISQRDNGDGTISVQFDDGSERLMRNGATNVPIAVIPPPVAPPPVAPTPVVPQLGSPAQEVTPEESYARMQAEAVARAAGSPGSPPALTGPSPVASQPLTQAQQHAAMIAKLPPEQQAAAEAEYQARQKAELAASVQGPPAPSADLAGAIPRGAPAGPARTIPAAFADAGGQRTIYSPETQRAHEESIAMQAQAGADQAARIGDLMQSEGEAASYLRQDIAIQNQRQQELRVRQDADMAAASADIRKTAGDIASTKIDPHRALAGKSTLGKISAAFGVALAAIGGAASRTGGNIALQIINDEIDRDVNAQVANLNNKRASLADKNSLYSQMLQRYGNADAAHAATKATLFEAAKLKADEFAAKRGDILANKGFADMAAGLMDKQAQWLAETQGVIKQAYAPAKVVGGGGGDSPINMIARAAARGSGGDVSKASATAYDLSMAQGLGESKANEAAKRAAGSVGIMTGQSSQDAAAIHAAQRDAYKEGVVTAAKGKAEEPKIDKANEDKIAAFQAAQQDLIKMKAAKGGAGNLAGRMFTAPIGVRTQSALEYEAARGAYQAHLRQAYGGRQPPEALLPKESLGGITDVPQALFGGSRFAALQKQLEADMERVQKMGSRGGAAAKGKPSDIEFEEPGED